MNEKESVDSLLIRQLVVLVVLVIVLWALVEMSQAYAAAQQAYATAMSGESARVQNAAERDRLTNLFKAVIPPLFLAATFATALYLLYRPCRADADHASKKEKNE